MKVALSMHIGQSLKRLKDNISNLVMRQFSSLLQQLIHVAMHVLEDKVQLVVLFDQLDQSHNVGVVKLGQDAHLV